MATIRTKKLGSGTHTAGAAQAVMYTVPAGHHARLRKVAIRSTNADTISVQAVDGVTGLIISLVPPPVYAALEDKAIALDDVLEAGDVVRIGGIAVGNSVTWWLSGTEYED